MEKISKTPQSFIGLHRNGDSWRWTDGTVTDYVDGWGDAGPPDEQDCAVLSDQGQWSAVNCSSQQTYDCKFKACKLLFNSPRKVLFKFILD